MLTFREAAQIPRSQPSVNDSVLLIVDVQKEYESGPVAVTGWNESSKKIAALLERYRAANGSIVHVLHNGLEGAPVFTKGTERHEPSDIVKPKEGEPVVVKAFPSSFAGTNLDEIIKATGKNKVVVVGYLTHNCIAYTVGDAAMKGYEVSVVSDATGTRPLPGADNAEEIHKAYLGGMADFFATIITSEEVA